MNVDRVLQVAVARRLYAADPERSAHGDSDCWIAACFVAYDLLAGEYDARQFKLIADYYGLENVL